MEMIVHRAGAFTSVQDLGRRGFRAAGVPACGAMDEVAHRVANLLVGNAESAATIEATLSGPLVSFDHDCTVAACGATVSGVPGWQAIRLIRGRTLELGPIAAGCRVYLAVAGGFDVPEVLASRSTDARNGLGGLAGRRLIDGDRVPVAFPGGRTPPPLSRVAESIVPPYGAAPTLRVIPGEHAGLVDRTMFGATFTVQRDSDRVGIRLSPAPGAANTPGDLPSSVVFPGTIQLPPDARPIVLGPDAGTLGGYAVIAHVIAADLPVLAQLRPGHEMRLTPTTLAEAHRLLAERNRALAIFRAGLTQGT